MRYFPIQYVSILAKTLSPSQSLRSRGFQGVGSPNSVREAMGQGSQLASRIFEHPAQGVVSSAAPAHLKPQTHGSMDG